MQRHREMERVQRVTSSSVLLLFSYPHRAAAPQLTWPQALMHNSISLYELQYLTDYWMVF